jgi:hypothetical protein
VLSRDRLYRPAGMTSTSSSFADFIGAANHASTHVKVGSQWVAKYVRDPDAQSPVPDEGVRRDGGRGPVADRLLEAACGRETGPAQQCLRRDVRERLLRADDGRDIGQPPDDGTGPKPITFPLAHYDGDVFSYQTVGENAVGLSGVTFTGSGGRAGSVRVENLDHTGLGTFKRN